MIDEGERIDLRWLPVAKAAHRALLEQQKLVAAHVVRVAERRDRYAVGSIQHAMAATEVALWTQIAEVTGANLEGKVVMPS